MIRGYHKPIMIAGGLGNVRRKRCGEARGRGRRAAGGARRPGDADRSRRRCRLLGRQRAELLGSRFRVGAARQSRDPTARAGSDRPLLGAGRCAIPSCSSTMWARAACRTPLPEAIAHTPARRAHRSAQDSERRARAVADGDLVQRGAGALRARARAEEPSSASPRCASASAVPFAVVGEITGDGRIVRQRSAALRHCRSTCRWRCCSASRRA